MIVSFIFTAGTLHEIEYGNPLKYRAIYRYIWTRLGKLIWNHLPSRNHLICSSWWYLCDDIFKNNVDIFRAGWARGRTRRHLNTNDQVFFKSISETTLKEFLKSIFETFENISLMFDQLPRESPPSSTLLLWQQKGICSTTLRWGIGIDIFRQSFFILLLLLTSYNKRIRYYLKRLTTSRGRYTLPVRFCLNNNNCVCGVSNKVRSGANNGVKISWQS